MRCNGLYCSLMGKRRNIYREVAKLPAKAMSVAQYSAIRGCDTANIYKLWRLKKGRNKTQNFEIVGFKGMNFVIPE